MPEAAAATGSVLLEDRGDVATIVLNRPDRVNAMDGSMVDGLHRALDAVEAGRARAVVVRGAGRGFCAGRDLQGADPGEEDARAILEEVFNPLIRRVAALDVPTFAAVHGPCLGTGLGLALACDVVHAADDARIGSPFARIGAVLDSGAHAAFVSRVGPHRALELVYTGRLLSGREAERWGLVNRSVAGADLVRTVMEMAEAVAAGPTLAFAESKRLVRRIAAGGLDLEAVLAAEAEAQGRACRTEDYREGIGAFLEKRVPAFRGR